MNGPWDNAPDVVPAAEPSEQPSQPETPTPSTAQESKPAPAGPSVSGPWDNAPNVIPADQYKQQQQHKSGPWDNAPDVVPGEQPAQSHGRPQNQWKIQDPYVAAARKDMSEDMFPEARGIVNQIYGKFISPVQRLLGGEEDADYTQRMIGGYEGAAPHQDKASKMLRGGLVGFETGTPSMLAGPVGMIADSSLSAMDSAITSGRDAGLSGASLYGHVLSKGIIEGGIQGFAMKAGLGGFKKFPGGSKAAQAAIETGASAAMKRYGVVGAEQWGQSFTAALASKLEDNLAGVDKSVMTGQSLLEMGAQTFVQTAMQLGMLSGSEVAAHHVSHVASRLKDMQSKGESPSRRQFAEMGLDPELGKSKEDRAATASEIVSQHDTMHDYLAGGAVEPKEDKPTPQPAISSISTEELPKLARDVPEQYGVAEDFVDGLKKSAVAIQQPTGKDMHEIAGPTDNSPGVQGEYAKDDQGNQAMLNGTKVVFVDPVEVNNHFLNDPNDPEHNEFTSGGNHSAYDFIPKDETWIDKDSSPKDLPRISIHEALEHHLMDTYGLPYSKGGSKHSVSAHDIAKTVEARWTSEHENGDVHGPKKAASEPVGAKYSDEDEIKSNQFGIGSGPIQYFQDLGERLANAFHSGMGTQELSKERDVVDTVANVTGRRIVNELQHATSRAMGKPISEVVYLAGESMPFITEAAGDKNFLLAEQAKLSSIPDAKVRKHWQAAMQYALDNFDRLNSVRSTIDTALKNQWFYENAEGIETRAKLKYWPRQWELQEEYSTAFPPKGMGQGKSFLKGRKFETFADALAAGYSPTDSQMNIFEARIRNGTRAIGMRKFLEASKNVIDPMNNKPVMMDAERDEKGNFKTPSGYVVTMYGSKPVAVQTEYAGLYSALLGHSLLQDSRVGRAAMKGVSWFKEGKTLFDTFHMGVVSMRGFFLNPYATMTGKAKPHEGMVLMDNTPSEIRLMAKNGEIPKEYLQHYLDRRDWQERGLRSGFNIGRVADNFSGEVIKDIPLVGEYNRYLFGEWQRGTMMQAYHMECERTERMLPELSRDQVATRVARDLNSRFGQMGRQGIFKHQTWQDISRLNAFAPSWLEGEIRSDFGSVYALKETARYAMQGRLVYNSLLKQAAVGMVSSLAAMQILNMVTRGHPTWDNPEEGFSNKLCAWIPSFNGKGPGVMLNPLGTVFPFFDRIVHYMEKTGSLAKTAEEIIKSKSGILPQAIYAAFESTRKDPSTWSAIKNVGEAILPVPISAGAAASLFRSTESGQLKEQSPGQVETQMFRSFGVHAAPAPGPETRIYGLADEFKSQYVSPTGVKQGPQKEFDASDYRELIRGLQQDDPDRQEEAIKELTKHKEERSIVQFFRSYPFHPFTGNRVIESQFESSLNPEQKEQYEKAREQRRQVRDRFFSKYGNKLSKYYEGM